jgi:dihydrofolate reductase
MKTIIIVAMTRDRVIGKDGRIPWHDSDDLKHFKRVTTGHAVIMGRKTFESIGKPLLGRRNIVLTRGENAETGNAAGTLDYVHSLEEALRLCRERNEEKAFIVGGGQIYAQALAIADEMIVTWVEGEDISGDTFFPEWDSAEWTEAPLTDPAFPRAFTYRRKRL